MYIEDTQQGLDVHPRKQRRRGSGRYFWYGAVTGGVAAVGLAFVALQYVLAKIPF